MVENVLVLFWISSSIPEIFAIEFWSCPKSLQILHVLASNIFWKRVPKILDWHYKIRPTADYVAKFHGDWPMELGDLAFQIKNKKTSAAKCKSIRKISFPGGLTKQVCSVVQYSYPFIYPFPNLLIRQNDNRLSAPKLNINSGQSINTLMHSNLHV